jgi:type VI secretion system secreted protein VgrG
MPPYDLPDNQTQSGIKSRSTQGGSPDNFNELRFEDKKGEEEVYLQAEKNMTTLVKNDQTSTIKRDRVTTIERNEILNVTGDITITIGHADQPDKPRKSGMNVTGKHRLDASDTIDIQAPNKITLTVGGSSITITPGDITITAGGSTIKLNADIQADSSGKSHLKLDANAFMKASGEASVLLDGNVCAQSKPGSQMLLDGDASMTTGGTVSLKGAKVNGKGDSEVGFDGGGSTATLTPASADIAGAQVNVNGKGVVSIGGPMVKIG